MIPQADADHDCALLVLAHLRCGHTYARLAGTTSRAVLTTHSPYCSDREGSPGR
ncbi:hypothetical protein ACWEWI_39720 [Streptomyces sp. NPDC003753]